MTQKHYRKNPKVTISKKNVVATSFVQTVVVICLWGKEKKYMWRLLIFADRNIYNNKLSIVHVLMVHIVEGSSIRNLLSIRKKNPGAKFQAKAKAKNTRKKMAVAKAKCFPKKPGSNAKASQEAVKGPMKKDEEASSSGQGHPQEQENRNKGDKHSPQRKR